MTKLNSLVGIFVVVLVAVSPIPFGSNRPFFWAIWGMLVGLVAVVYLFAAARSAGGLRIPLDRMKLSGGLWLVVIAWLVIQILPLGVLFGPFVIPLPGGQSITSNAISTAPGATWLMVIRLVTYGFVFLMALQAGANETRSTRMLTAVFWILVAHAGFSLLQLTQLGDTILGLPKIAYMGVATGTFINRNSFATFLAMGLCVGVALLPGIITAKRARNESVVDKALMVLLYLGGLFVIMVALLATESRMGLFAGVLGAFVVLLLELKQHRNRNILIPAALLVGAGSALAIVWTFGQGVLERALSLGGSSENRMDLYAQVWEQALTRPWLGFGGGAFSLYFPSYFGQPLRLDAFWDKAHSTYLALFSELGLVVGALPILAVCLLFGRILWSQFSSDRLHPARLAAIGVVLTCAVHSLVDFSLEIQANSFLFTAIVALGLAGTFRLHVK
jgi:O-antigen ligase